MPTETSLATTIRNATIAGVVKWAVPSILTIIVVPGLVRAFPILPALIRVAGFDDWLPWIGLMLAVWLLIRVASGMRNSRESIYQPIYRPSNRLALSSWVPEVATIEHDRVKWRVDMPPFPDAAIGNSFMPYVNEIGVELKLTSDPLCARYARYYMIRSQLS